MLDKNRASKKVYNEDTVGDSPDSAHAPASFAGRLNLSAYIFEISDTSTVSDQPITARVKQEREPRSRPITPPKRKSSNANETSTSAVPSSPAKRSKKPSGYAPPSTYASYPELPDVLAPNLFCILIGLNPGLKTSTDGHAYSHPSNLFWKLLQSSGLTDRRLHPSEDGTLPARFGLGNTNIVSRATRNGNELSKAEMDNAVATLEVKISQNKPESVCIVGKSIWESIHRVWFGKKPGKEFEYGWQEGRKMGEAEGDYEGARVFVATSTSGLAATVRPEEKERIWRVLGDWVNERRMIRGARLAGGTL